MSEMSLNELCGWIYERSGQDAVLSYAADYLPYVPWMECDGCEIESPVWDNACLVCGLEVAA